MKEKCQNKLKGKRKRTKEEEEEDEHVLIRKKAQRVHYIELYRFRCFCSQLAFSRLLSISMKTINSLESTTKEDTKQKKGRSFINNWLYFQLIFDYVKNDLLCLFHLFNFRLKCITCFNLSFESGCGLEEENISKLTIEMIRRQRNSFDF